MLQLLESTPVYVPALIAYNTGMRREEFLALHWSDLDRQNATINVRLAVEQVGKVVAFKVPKSKSSKRTRSLSAPALAALEAHRQDQLATRVKHANLWRDEDFIFPSLYYHGPDFPMGRVWTPTRSREHRAKPWTT